MRMMVHAIECANSIYIMIANNLFSLHQRERCQVSSNQEFETELPDHEYKINRIGVI